MSRLRAGMICLAAIGVLSGCAFQPESTQTTEPERIAVIATTSEPETVAEPAPSDPAKDMVDELSLEELVGQLFLVRCPESDVAQMLAQYQPGGLLLFGRDFDGQTPQTMEQTIQSYQQASPIPLLMAVDEEGDTVCRISSHSAFRSQRFSSPRSLYESGGLEAVRQEEQEKCQLLRQLGIQVNMAPVCDIATDPEAFMYRRSLGQNPEITAQFVQIVVSVMAQECVGSVLKHFPGYGNNVDTHTGVAVDTRSYQSFQAGEFLPFTAGIEAGCDAILVSHNIVTSMDETLPASLSPAVHTILREDLGFTGVIVTDDLAMDAISDLYGAGEAAVLAIQAGNDLLCISDIQTSYAAVLKAVQEGDLSRQQISDSVRRIFHWKQKLGLLEYN